MADTELQQLAKTDRNPIQERRYKELLAQSGVPYFQGGNTATTAQFNTFAITAKMPTADDIIREQKAKLTEQVTFLKDFLSVNPLAYDEMLAKSAAGEKYRPYYEEILADFVAPLQEKIAYSTATQGRVLNELTRQTALGEKQKTRETQAAVERARGGFAGAGLLGSGLERGATARTEVTGKENLQDFLAQSEYTRAGTTAAGAFERGGFERQMAQKERDVFGRGREFETAVTREMETKRQEELKRRSLRALEAVSSRFGSPLPEIPNYLELYNV